MLYKKAFLLLAACTLQLPLFAQVLQNVHQLMPGDVFRRQFVDSTNVTEGAVGPGVTWDFSNLSLLPVTDTILFRTPTSDELLSFPDADLVQEGKNAEFLVYFGGSGPEMEYFHRFPDSLHHLGWMQTLGADNGPSEMSDPAKIMQYPFVYTDFFTDSLRGVFYGFGVFNYAGSSTVTATGVGTLILPTGTFPNVTKVEEQDIITPSYPAKPWLRRVAFYSPADRYPVFVIQNFSGLKTAWITSQLTTGVPGCEPGFLSVYPSVNQGAFTVLIRLANVGNVKLKLISPDGKIIEARESFVQTTEERIEMKVDAAAGLYLLQMELPTGELLTRKVMIAR